MLWYKFPHLVTISGAYRLYSSSLEIYVYFYDRYKNVIDSVILNDGNNEYSIYPSVSNVQYVSFGALNTGFLPLYEIDLFGFVQPVVHDELSNLNISSNYNSSSLSWSIPSSNPDFTGVKIYRNGSLIKTLGGVY